MHIEQWPITRPVPYPNNPRTISEQAIEKVAASLQEFGWQQPLVVDAEGVLIVGHTRLRAAQKLGHREVPVFVARHLTPAEARAYRLADNRTQEEADWNQDLLIAEIEGLQLADYPILLTGYQVGEIAELLAGAGELLEPRGDKEARRSKLAKQRRSLDWGSVSVPMTPEEEALLDEAYCSYTAAVGESGGFAASLLARQTDEARCA